MSSSILTSLKEQWRASNLSTQFAVTAAAVIGFGMALLGWWVVGQIERGVVSHAAASAALHMDVFIEPSLQDLKSADKLPPSSQNALREIVSTDNTSHAIAGISVWRRDGELIFSTCEDADTRRRIDHAKVITSAWNGSIQSDFVLAPAATGRFGAQKAGPVLKVFAPMHARDTGNVIAVAELNAVSPELAASLSRARIQTTGVVGLLSLAMVASLFGIVRRGSRMIGEQKTALEARVHELTGLLAENATLQSRIVDVNRRATDNNDKAMRRIGAELHDGPVQLIALSLLRLETIRLPGTADNGSRNFDDFDAIEAALREALKEIRDLCSGLSLPNLERVPVVKVIEYAIMNHERRSRTNVAREIASDLPLTAPPLILTCVYRFIQEALNNAVRHAGGKDQKVSARCDGRSLLIAVSDGGPGVTAQNLDPTQSTGGHGLGLSGLKDRIETLGGRFTISSAEDQGTLLSAELTLDTNIDPSARISGILQS